MKVQASIIFPATSQSVKDAPFSKSSDFTPHFGQFKLHLSHSQFQLTRSTLTLWYYMAGEHPHVPPYLHPVYSSCEKQWTSVINVNLSGQYEYT